MADTETVVKTATDQEPLIPDTYPLGDDGPAQTEIDQLKEKHGPVKACFIASKLYVIRMMTRQEYVEFQNEINDRMAAGDNEFDVDAEISTRYTVWPNPIQWGDEPGGSATVLAQEVSKFSGFVADRESVEL
tara:strand:+ start:44259 stop:44654 length:396 start_codon:yes stop_codon:yes gene_type:complete